MWETEGRIARTISFSSPEGTGAKEGASEKRRDHFLDRSVVNSYIGR